MYKSLYICGLLCMMLSTQGLSADRPSWQWLNLRLSSTYIYIVKEGQADLDSCLLKASSSLGLSRYSILAEGIDDPELQAQSRWIDQQDPGQGNRYLSTAKGKSHLEILILLGAWYAFQPRSYYHYRDSIEYFLTRALMESRTMGEGRLGRQALCLLEKIYLQGNNVQHGDSVYNQLIHECEVAGDKETEVRALTYHALYLPQSPANVPKKLSDLLKTVNICHELNNPEGEINALVDIGFLRVSTSQLQDAYDVFLKALGLAEAIHYPYIQYNTDALAFVASAEGKFGESLKYTLRTIKVAESSRDSIGWALFYGRLAFLYRSEGGREKESAVWLKKALDRLLPDRNPDVYNYLIDLVNQMEAEGRGREALPLVKSISEKVPPVTYTDRLFYHMAFAVCYLKLRDFKMAQAHLLMADSMEKKAESVRGPLRKGWIYSGYGFLYFDQGQYRKARSYFEASLSTFTRGDIDNDLRIYRSLIMIDSFLHDPAAGITHYKQYTKLLDSAFTVSRLRQAEELQVIYQTEEKEKQIEILNQQAKLEKAQLEQASLVKDMFIAGIIAVLIIAGLLYRQNRLRKRTNEVITHKNEQLQNFLREKEWLLKEIHHRVKNNLQIVMSLLNSQSMYIDNDAALTAIHDSQHRVYAMSLIHQRLYNSENVSYIDMTVYIRELVSYLSDSFNTFRRIRFELTITPLEMNVNQAVPFGLILNEAVTNSIKYAFPEGRNGIISISLSSTAPNLCLLSISDNGIGIPVQSGAKKPGSLGMTLMEGLSGSLDGHFSIENKNGTTIKIAFVHDPVIKDRYNS